MYCFTKLVNFKDLWSYGSPHVAITSLIILFHTLFPFVTVLLYSGYYLVYCVHLFVILILVEFVILKH